MTDLMTGDTMRSDVLDQDQLKIEGRPPISKRKMPRNTSVYENGDFDADLNFAIQESLKYAKRESSTPHTSSEEINQNDQRPSQSSEEPVQLYEEPRVSEADPDETRHLKELLLLHLDLIQQQQELLLAKDKQITTLQKDKEALQCRLERMERRMSMLSKSQEVVQQQLEATLQLKQSPNDHRLTQGSDQRLTTPEKAQTGGRRRRSLEPEVFNSFVSSKANQDDSRLGEDQQQQNNNNNNKNVFSKPRKFAYRRRRREIQTRTESETDEIRGNDSESENTGIKFDLRQRIESRKRAKLEASKNRAGTKIIGVTSETQETEDVLRTDCLYVTTVCEFPLPPEPDIKLSKQAQVEVPTWRVNPVTNCYQLEGTENLTDESYSKKHLKPEMEERRRKRWDLQRLREQKMLEKLEKGRYKCHFADKSKGGTENHSQESTSSLLPSLDDIQYIEVCDKIAVSAFGYAIPHLEPSEFALPWGEASQRETTRMRTPQKRR